MGPCSQLAVACTGAAPPRGNPAHVRHQRVVHTRWNARAAWRCDSSSSSGGGDTNAASSGGGSSNLEKGHPSSFGFQINERYLQWDSSAGLRLMLIWVAEQLDESVEEVEQRLGEVAVLLPFLVERLPRMRAPLVLELARDPAELAQRLVRLREALPGLDLSSLLAASPQLLLQLTPEAAAAALGTLHEVLGPSVQSVERLVEREPLLLLADVRAVLGEIERLLPGENPIQVLVIDPSIVLDMQAAGLPSSLAIDDGIAAP